MNQTTTTVVKEAAKAAVDAAPNATRALAENLYPVEDVLALGFSHYIIIIFSVIAIAWGTFMAKKVR